MTNEMHHDQAPLSFQEKLDGFGKTLADYNLPTPASCAIDQYGGNKELWQEMQYNRDREHECALQYKPLLKSEQKAVYHYVCSCLERNLSSIVFIDAPGGTGKTFVINFTLSKAWGDRSVFIAVAASSIAATLMSGGRTAHSRFKTPLKVKEHYV